ncbi:prolyl aminopeptidase [Francisella sp. SYW-9]|uniref:prolyl aminopeptidase n=1 Tax=Francisella sp. SYW-9 TaxID=2610888 RepID=UPI00123DFDBB|nr:prolyl aminopeptidase [Francisella sp. SYW-9]
MDDNDIKDTNIISSGYLDVGDNHSIYYVDWGNKNIEIPIFHLHGGPGAGFSKDNFSNFDPKRHRVIFHDQRGSGRSRFSSPFSNNTSWDLVSDICKLRKHLGFDKISLYGFSWGSTLALLYSIENPNIVEKMLIGGVFLAREIDIKFYIGGGGASTHFPEVWQRFRDNAPIHEKLDIKPHFLQELLSSKNEDQKKRFAREWLVYESSLFQLDFTGKNLESELEDFASESVVFLEAHYILNKCFLKENYILDNAYKIKHIPITIVHGRYDFICMPSAAYELKKALDEETILHFVTSGHSNGDMVQREVVKAYLNFY